MTGTRRAVAVWSATLLCASPLFAQSSSSQARLLKDIGVPPAVDSHVDGFTRLGPWTYFIAGDFAHLALWRTGGTSASTTMVVDLSTRPGGGPIGMMARAAGKLFLRAENLAQTWVSDGTAAGTSRLLLSGIGPLQLDSAAELNGKLFAYAGNGVAVLSDGTPAGTTQLAVPDLPRIVTGPVDDGSGRERLWFSSGSELWETDGTASGTRLVTTRAGYFDSGVATGPFHIAVQLRGINSESIEIIDTRNGQSVSSVALPSDSILRPHGVTTLRGMSGGVFSIVSGRWAAVPDAVAIAAIGTSLVPVSLPGPAGQQFFVAGLVGQTLWLVDVAGRIARLDPGNPAAIVVATSARPSVERGFVVVGDRIFYDSVGPLHELIELDTRTSSPRVRFSSGLPHRLSVSTRLTEHFGRVLFATGRAPFGVGYEPHVHDPVTGTTAVLADTAVSSESGSAPRKFARFGDRVTFIAEQDWQTTDTWITDGTPAGTRVIAGLGEGMTYAEVGSDLWVTRFGYSNQPWTVAATDGTSVRQLASFASSGAFQAAAGLGDRMILAGYSGTQSGFFAVDAAGNLVVLASAPDGTKIVVVGDHAYLVGSGLATGQRDVWLTDGTATGTRHVGVVPGLGVDAVAFDDRLWVSSSSGTFVVDPVTGVTPFSAIQDARLVAADRRLYGVAARTLYVTDGTIANTVATPLSGHTGARSAAALGHRLLFAVDGRPWVSDGTANGTVQLLPNLVDGQWAVTGPDRAFFLLEGAAIVVTDGSPAGTRIHQQLAVVSSRTNGSSPTLHVANGRVYLMVDDPSAGREPFVLDPDAVAEVVGAPCSADPARLPTVSIDASPAVGRVSTVSARSTGSVVSLVVLGLPALRAQALFAGRCSLHVDPGGLAAIALPSGPGGAVSLPLAVPSSPAFQGLRLMLQAAFLQPNGEVDVSEGLLLQVGG